MLKGSLGGKRDQAQLRLHVDRADQGKLLGPWAGRYKTRTARAKVRSFSLSIRIVPHASLHMMPQKCCLGEIHPLPPTHARAGRA